MSHNGIRCNALNRRLCYIVCINVADKCKCRILCQLLLELCISLFAYLRIVRLTRLGQILIHQLIGIAGIVRALIGTKYLIGVVIRIKRAAPSDQVCHLSAPVYLCRNLNAHIHADFLQLLGSCLRNIDTHLIACAYADHKADLLTIPVVEAVFSHRTARIFQNLFCLFRIVIVMLNVFIVINVSLKRSVRRHTLSKQHRLNDCFPVNAVAHCRNDILIFRPVFIRKVKQNSTVIGCLHIIAGIALLICKHLCILRCQQRQIQLTGLHLHCLRIVIRNDLKYNLVNLRLTLEVFFIFLQRNRLSLIPLCELVRAGTDRMTEEIRLLHILTGQQMLRQHSHRHIVKKCYVRRIQLKCNRMIVNHIN